jgi:RNA polymerase sigma-70 factor (ECF subfamily)
VNASAADAALLFGSRLRLADGLSALAHAVWGAADTTDDLPWPAAGRALVARASGANPEAGRPSHRPSPTPRPAPVPAPRSSPRPSGSSAQTAWPGRTAETSPRPAPRGGAGPTGGPDPASGRGRRPRPDEPRPDERRADGPAPGEVWTIVERAQGGDIDAFGELYDRYINTVFRYAYYRVGSRQLAEDLTSETFLRALRRIGSVTWQGRDLGAWLVTIARNLIADHYKSSRYRLEVTTADVLDVDQEDQHSAGHPESEVLERLTNAALLDAVRKLNPEQQECVVLRFLQGFSVAETAEAMGKNEGAIKALQYRAIRRLGRLLPPGFTP